MWKLLQYQTVFDEFYAACSEDMQIAIDQRLDHLCREGNRARAPYSKYLTGTDGILECRPRAGKEQARLLYFFLPEKRIVIVVAARKDQRKLDSEYIKTAEKRKHEIEKGMESPRNARTH